MDPDFEFKLLIHDDRWLFNKRCLQGSHKDMTSPRPTKIMFTPFGAQALYICDVLCTYGAPTYDEERDVILITSGNTVVLAVFTAISTA